MKQKKFRTDFLTHNFTFGNGCGSVFDLSGEYFKFDMSESGSKADFKAIECDWAMIGEDLQKTLDHVCIQDDGQLTIEFDE